MILASLLAHGGVGGAIIEVSVALLIAALGLAAWVGGRREKERERDDSERDARDRA